MRYQVLFIQMRGRGCRWHGSDIEWGINPVCGIWLAGLKPNAYTASASIHGALASGVARETHAKLVVAALGDVPISEDEAVAVIGSGAHWRRCCNRSRWQLGAVKGRYALSYFGITSRANLLATTSRSSARFFPASIMASRDP
jgi:hypothetical protein